MRAFFQFLRMLSVAALAVSVVEASAQTYPVRPIRLIVPLAAGGGTDIWSRIIAQKLGDALGQPVVVDNRTGAAGVIGVDAAAKAPADGYTILIGGGSTMAANVSLYKLPYDPVNDFVPLANAVSMQFAFVVNPSLPASNMKDLIALSKARPGELNYGSATNAAQICTEMLKSMTGANIARVPYKSTAQALTDLFGGTLQVICEPLATAIPSMKAGRLKALAVTGSRRSVLAPEVPTVAETGVPGFEYVSWVGFFAPAGTPKDIVGKLSAEIIKVLKDSATVEKLKAAGAEATPTGAEELGVILKEDITRFAKVIKEAGIKTP